MEKLTWKYIKNLKDENAIKFFENEINIKLPNDIITYVHQYNGGRPSKKLFDTEKSSGRVIKSLLSFNVDDLETIYDAYSVVKNSQPYLVPIASDPSGNYICFNSLNNTIVFWFHENTNFENICDNFTNFLNNLY